MTCTVNMPEFQGFSCEPDSDNAAAMRFLVNHTGKKLELLGFVTMLGLRHAHGFFATCTVKMLEILGFFGNKWLSFRPVAHRNRPI